MTPVESIEADPRWTTLRVRVLRCAICGCVLEPSAQAARPTCPTCGTTTCPRCASPCCGCVTLAELRAVCAGEPIAARQDPSIEEAGKKLFHIVRTFGRARDVLFACERVVVRALGANGYHQYVATLGPDALRDVLRDTRIARLDRPVVAHAVASESWPEFGGTSREELAWLIPLACGVEVRFRPMPSEGPPPAPMEIPMDGARELPPKWALPPPWTAPRPEVVDGSGVPCLHCACPSPLYRALFKAYVCPECGRSFPSEALDARPRTTR